MVTSMKEKSLALLKEHSSSLLRLFLPRPFTGSPLLSASKVEENGLTALRHFWKLRGYT